MQIVLKNNRVMAHGGEYLTLGNSVLDVLTGKIYVNATLAECESCPPDIDIAGYEYHAGEFVPCAPYGIGNGNVAVVCGEDCKSIKDSGVSFADIIAAAAGIENGTYKGNVAHGKTGNKTLTFSRAPQLVIINAVNRNTVLKFGLAIRPYPYVLTFHLKQSYDQLNITGKDDIGSRALPATWGDKSLSWSFNESQDSYYSLNGSGEDFAYSAVTK